MGFRGYPPLICLLIGLSACTAASQVSRPTPSPEAAEIDSSGCVVGSVPAALAFDPFYQKYCDAGGIPVISSTQVDDLALQQAYSIIMNMLAPIPAVRQQLVDNGAYFAVIAKNERLTSLPEYAGMDADYWDNRARGLGGGIGNPITSSAEENLLCLRSDRRYPGESIAVHEFAHTIALLGMGEAFPALVEEATEIYEAALAKGLWQDTYAGSDLQEYWAEGVQSYFNANAQSELGDGVHNFVNTRSELAEYDPALHDFISKIFNGHQWTPACP